MVIVEVGRVKKVALDQQKHVDDQFDRQLKALVRAELEPVEARESGLITQIADGFDFLLVPNTDRSVKGDVLEDPLRSAYLETKRVFLYYSIIESLYDRDHR